MDIIKFILRLLVYFITVVCIYDIYCTVKFNEFLLKEEKNPIAQFLITQENYQFFKKKTDDTCIEIIRTNVSKLVLFKVLGLVAALEIFDWLINSRYNRITSIVVFTIVIMQFSLLLYLTLV